MATVKLLVSEMYIKDATIIAANVDPKYIRGNIQTGQDLYIETTLGTLLFNDINDKANAGTLASNDLVLYSKYVKPCLKYYVLCLCAPELTYKFTNKNVSTKSSDNAQPVDGETVKQISQRYRDLGDEYRQRMINYLCENYLLFPLYDLNTGLDEIQPKRKGYQNPIFLGDTNSCDCE
jgi:hypothetical protein